MILFNRFAYAGSAAPPPRQSRLVEYFVFSLLLHILIVLLFGTPVGDGISRGQKIFGALNVTLNNSLSGLLNGEGPVDSNADIQSHSIPQPSPARSSVAQPSESITEVLPLRNPAPESAATTTETQAHAPGTAPELTKEISQPATTFIVSSPTIEARPVLPSVDSKPQEKPTEQPHPDIMTSPKAERVKIPPPVMVKPEVAPMPQSPVIEPAATPKPEPPSPAPAPVEPREAPAAQTVIQPPELSTPLPTPQALQPEIPVIPSPARERAIRPRIEPAVVIPQIENKATVLPPLPNVPLQAPTPPKTEPSVTTIVKPEVKPAAIEPIAPSVTSTPLPATTQLPASTVAAPNPEQKSRELSPAPASSAERASPTPAVSTQRPAAVPSPLNGTTDQGSKAQGDKPAALANSGNPVGNSAGNSTGPSSGPSVDLETLRNQAANNSRRGSGSGQSGVFQLQAPPVIEERKSKLAKALDKAGKSDCREAYSGMGLAAAVPLAASSFRDSGCKW